MSLPTWFDLGTPVVATVTAVPVRTGRRVMVSRYDQGAWTVVATKPMNARGTASFTLPTSTSGAQIYRATLASYAGARPYTTAPVRTVTGTRQQLSLSVEGAVGSTAVADLAPDLTRVTDLESVIPTTSGSPTVSLDEAQRLHADIASDQAQGDYAYTIKGVGCAGDTCDIGFTLDLDLTVIGLGDLQTKVDNGVIAFSEPSSDRLALAEPLGQGASQLVDEVILTLGTDTVPGDLGQAEGIAGSVGATVTGGIPEIGVYELRWPQPLGDVDTMLAQLRLQPGVSAAEPSLVDGLTPTVVPSDWSDDGEAVRWPFEQSRIPQAWDLVADKGSAPVGIVDDNAVWSGHEDLDVTQAFGAFTNDDNHGTHATHVAGLACAKANGIGVVGAGWGCPVISDGIHTNTATLDKDALMGAYDVVEAGARVVNMSLGYNISPRCATEADSEKATGRAEATKAALARLFNGAVGRDVVWVFSAGNNCSVGPQSPMGRDWALPNVITVAASNSDGTLASYSNFGEGVEVAAGGGVGVGIAGADKGPISTVFKDCGLFGLSICSSYAPMTGTSMASPIVAGVASLLRSEAPGRSAADVGSCIVSTAGTNTGSVTSRSAYPKLGWNPPSNTYYGSIPIVDAEAAVKCIDGAGPPKGDVLITGMGDRTASGNGTDRGDLVVALTLAGYQTYVSDTVPTDLSGFREVWYLDTDAMAPADEDRVAAYVQSGGGLYLTGEWGCCSVDSTSIDLINRLTGDAVAHAGVAGDDVAIGASAAYGLGLSPHPVDSILTATPGSLSGVPAENVVGTASGGTQVVAAAWDTDQATGRGQIAIVMDINWIAEQYRGASWSDFVSNLAWFLG